MRRIKILISFVFILSFFAQADFSDIKNLKQIDETTFNGGQPNREQIDKLASEGFNTVINVRGDGEFSKFNEQQAVEDKGMQYLHLPIDSKQAFTRENVKKFRVMLDSTEGKTFLHCGSGNRVGALFALDAHWNQGVPASEALTIGVDAGMTSLQSHIFQLMNSAK